MPFNLWNTGSTFQRWVDKVFKNQIGWNILACIDDILVKFVATANHANDLEETLGSLAKYGMQLNPTKCTFGVEEGRFLGFA